MINWGVLTTAGIAHGFTVPALKNATDCRAWAIAGRNPEKVNAFKEEFSFVKAYYSPEELLDDPDIDAVYIPMPNNLHSVWVKKAADAKKNILCEKPLTGNYADTLELFDYCEDRGVYLMEAFAYLHTPYISEVKRIISSGAIGDISMVESCFYTPFYTQENIRVRRETLGGAMYDLGCYTTSLVLWLLEKEPDEIKAIAHFTNRQIDDLATAYMWYNDGRKAVVSCGMCSESRGDRFFVYGTKGVIEAPVQFNECGKKEIIITNGNSVKRIDVDIPNNYTLEFEQFARVVEGKQNPLLTREFSLMNARTLDRILESMGY